MRLGLPWWFSDRESTCQCRGHRFHLWVGKILWRRKWQPHSSILAWKIAQTEKPGGLQYVGSQRARHDRATKATAALPLGLSEAQAPVCVTHITWVRRDNRSPAPSAGVKAAASSPAPPDSPPPSVSLAWSRLPELPLSRCKHATQWFSPQSQQSCFLSPLQLEHLI